MTRAERGSGTARGAGARSDALQRLLVTGVLLRVTVFALLAPSNNDPHAELVDFVVRHGRTANIVEHFFAFHPPLYYVLAAPLCWLGSLKLVQLLSLLLGLWNLFLLHDLIRSTRLLVSHRARAHAMAFAALLPQLVLFGSFVSNDALAFPLGSLLFVQVLRYAERPSRRERVRLTLVLTAALLTKGLFLPSLVLAGLVVLVVEAGRRVGLVRALARAGIVLVVAGVAGSYKYVENQLVVGTPFVNQDVIPQAWIVHQQGTVRGWRSFANVDVLELVKRPYVGPRTKHSLPLLYYGTFWYSYINPESSFNATRAPPWDLVPRALYLVALVPTLLGLYGLAALAMRLGSWRSPASGDPERRTALVEVAFVLGSLVLQLALVTTWGLKHDAWSFFQARLVFPSFFAIAACMAAGWEAVAWPIARRPLELGLFAVHGLAGVYFLVELGGALAAMGG